MNFSSLILIVLLLTFFPGVYLSAEDVHPVEYENSFNFSIRYLGMRVAAVRLTDSYQQGTGRIEVEATSVSFGNLLFKIDNRYTIEYQEHYQPYIYSKSIKQKNFSQNKTTLWNRERNEMEIWIDCELKDIYQYGPEESHDFFSSLMMIRHLDFAEQTSHLDIYANNNTWSALITNLGEDRVARKKSIKYRIDFHKDTDNPTQRSDVLTNNIVKEENALFLWITADENRLPIQAEYSSSPFSVFWSLENYRLSSDQTDSAKNNN